MKTPKQCVVKRCPRLRRKKGRYCAFHHAKASRQYRARLKKRMAALERENQRRRAVQSRVW